MRKTVCVDLDGVLAAYDKWRGIEHFGEPLPGAVEFTIRLGQFSNVLIFTGRCREKQADCAELGYGKNDDLRSAAELQKLVADWLNKHGFHYDGIWTAPGKPIAAAYVDDRSVVCRPQENNPEYGFCEAEHQVKKLCGVE